MADQQPTVVKNGDDPWQYVSDGCAQQEETAHSDSDSDSLSDVILSTELSTSPTSVMNGERIIINLW